MAAATAAFHCLSSTFSPPTSSFSSRLSLPPGPKSFTIRSSSELLTRSHTIKSLAFSSNLSPAAFPIGGDSLRALGKTRSPRRSIVCEAAPVRKADSAAKRARQAEKRRIYNKAHKSEIRTRMRKVFEELDSLRKKTAAQAEELFPIEKLIAEAYSAIDKAVKVGTLHRNTGAHRKSRLARRKKAVEIHHGWYSPATTA